MRIDWLETNKYLSDDLAHIIMENTGLMSLLPWEIIPPFRSLKMSTHPWVLHIRRCHLSILSPLIAHLLNGTWSIPPPYSRHERIPLVSPQSKAAADRASREARPPAPPNPLSVRHFPILLTFPPPFLDALPLPPPLPNPSHTHHHHHDHVCFFVSPPHHQTIITRLPIPSTTSLAASQSNPADHQQQALDQKPPCRYQNHQKQKTKLVASHGECHGEWSGDPCVWVSYRRSKGRWLRKRVRVWVDVRLAASVACVCARLVVSALSAWRKQPRGGYGEGAGEVWPNPKKQGKEIESHRGKERGKEGRKLEREREREDSSSQQLPWSPLFKHLVLSLYLC